MKAVAAFRPNPPDVAKVSHDRTSVLPPLFTNSAVSIAPDESFSYREAVLP